MDFKWYFKKIKDGGYYGIPKIAGIEPTGAIRSLVIRGGHKKNVRKNCFQDPLVAYAGNLA